MQSVEYSGEMIVPDPVYLICQREAVQVEDGKPIILDPGFLYTVAVTDESEKSLALLVYLKERGARIFLDWKNDPALTIAMFRKLSDMADYLENAGLKWIKLNKIPGENDGWNIRTTHFIDQIRKRMADGA
jgi:hypothetical protein